jgi:hypothetical protein
MVIPSVYSFQSSAPDDGRKAQSMKQWLRKLGSALFIVMLGGMLLELLYQLYSAWTYHVIYGGRGQGWPSYDSRPIAFWWSVILCCFGTVMLTVAIPCFIWDYFSEKSIGASEKKVPPSKTPFADQFQSDEQTERA